ncbi:unnamed protein product [Meloidogyne enterolobii]|uniref:Uncharacterized protein n=1 Tax=Meloidogyne enterolobii TaxID=390850 RepID=A0ACB1AJ20_MELEN
MDSFFFGYIFAAFSSAAFSAAFSSSSISRLLTYINFFLFVVRLGKRQEEKQVYLFKDNSWKIFNFKKIIFLIPPEISIQSCSKNNKKIFVSFFFVFCAHAFWRRQ